MLPRHLRRALPASRYYLEVLQSKRSPLQTRQNLSQHWGRNFHGSSQRLNELPKSPFQTFVDVLKDELQKNRELQDNVKQLQGDVDKLQDSEAMKKARAAYERARVRYFRLLGLVRVLICLQLTSSIKENPRLRAAADELKKQGIKVGDAVSEALKSMEESELMRAVRVSLFLQPQLALKYR